MEIREAADGGVVGQGERDSGVVKDGGPRMEKDGGSRVVLPEGVTIGEVRRSLEVSQGLYVEFCGRDRKKWTLGQDNPPRTFVIVPDVKYRVNVNAGEGDDVYLNPVEEGDFPEDSDISTQLDKFLSTRAGREKLGVEVVVTSSDADLGAVVERLWSSVYREVGRRFRVEYGKLDRAKIGERVWQGMTVEWERGVRASERLADAVYIWAEEEVYRAAMRGEKLAVEEVVEGKMRILAQKLIQLARERVIQLGEAATQRGEVALAVDVVNVFSDLPNEGVLAVVGYKPKFGWGLALAVGDCPNLAAGFFDDVMMGKCDAGNERTMEELVELERAGKLRIDRDKRTIVWDNRDGGLDHTMAVFHPGGSVREAVETLDMVSDPVRGQGAFKFLIFVDTSGVEYEEMEPIRLVFD